MNKDMIYDFDEASLIKIEDTKDTVVKEVTANYILDLDDAAVCMNGLGTLVVDLTDKVNRRIEGINAKRADKKYRIKAGMLNPDEDEYVAPSIPALASPAPYMVASLIMAKHHVIRLNYGGTDSSSADMCPIAVYNDEGDYAGVYTTDESDIESIIRDAVPTISKRGVDECKAFLRTMAPVKSRCSDSNLIPVNNGIYDYKNKTLMDFSPEYVFSSKVSTDYNPNAANVVIHNDVDGTDWDIESWMKDLSDHPEAANLFWQIIGATVRSNERWNQAAFFYSTKGNNGKGTLCRLIRNLVGMQNCCSISLDAMGREFMLSPLLKASAIVVDENDVGTYIEKSANLKSIVTGDSFSINRKHLAPISFSFSGFMIQCLNDAPKFRDKTDSILRRIIFVPFDKCFTGRERKYIKEDYLGRQEVLEYVLKKVLEDLPEYHSIDTPQYCIDALADFRLSNDNVAEFMSEVLDDLQWSAVTWKELYAFYRGWLKKYGAGTDGRACVKYRDFRSSARTILDTGVYDWEYHHDDGQFEVDKAERMTYEPLIERLDVENDSEFRGRINEAGADLTLFEGMKDRIRGIRRAA